MSELNTVAETPSNPSSSPKPATSSSMIVPIAQNLLLLAFMCAVVLAFCSVVTYPAAPEDFWMTGGHQQALRKQIEKQLPAAFGAKFKTFHEEVQGVGMSPSLVFEGDKARVVLQEEATKIPGGWLRADAYETFILAQTSGGRYFWVQYKATTDGLEHCASTPMECIGQEHWSQLTRAEAMDFYFRSANGTDAGFEREFGVKPGPHKVPA